jgi:phenylalanyl-tRNA synthetase beta chain
MYISYNWLKDFVKIPAKLKPRAIAEELTGHTVEVEGLVNQADQFNKVVVGRVLEVGPHPNADRLRLTVVDIKTKKLNIVCGAPNVAVGQLVPVALVGAKLPNGLEIQESVIRGEKSQGMLCAADELGLGKDHAGILVLKDTAQVGMALAKYLKADDVILEIDNKSLSNRPDLLNHYGLAREVGAIFSLPLKPYDKFWSKKMTFLTVKDNKLSVKVEEPELCPRYLAVEVRNIIVAESPEWLKARLVAIGQRPINNIVDLTNYVMFDCGQPLHAFDAAQIKKIVVRRAVKDEILETLDEKERTLDNDDLVITDGQQLLGLAGIMGGQESGVTPTTTSLLIESANFSATAIRKTSQKLGLRTEASIRFEKSLDPNLTIDALSRFLTLLQEICPTLTIASSLIDIDNTKLVPVMIDLDLAWLNRKLGQEIGRETVIGTLQRLGFTVDQGGPNLQVTVPSWRATKDVTSREDLAEEILRLYGYDKIPAQLPVLELNLPEVNEERKLERKIKNILVWQAALSEVYNYSFVGEDQLTKLNIDFFQHLRLANPLAETQNLLRQSLVPGLVGNIKTNQFKAGDLGFFELGSVFFNAPGTVKKDMSADSFLPYQEKHLGLAVAGNADLLGRLKSTISGLLKNLINYETEPEYSAVDNIPGWADQSAVAKITVLGQELGLVGQLNLAASANLNLKKPVALAEINFSRLADLVLNWPSFRFQEAAKYPPVMRDLAFVVTDRILYNDLRQTIAAFNPLIKSVELFDVYSGDKLLAGYKSLAFHVLYQSPVRTLTAAEVDQIQQSLVERLAQKLGAQLRDF